MTSKTVEYNDYMKITDIDITFPKYLGANPNFTGILRNTLDCITATGYFVNGKYHREPGPAYERADGFKRWHLNDIQYYSKAQYEQELINKRMKRIVDDNN